MPGWVYSLGYTGDERLRKIGFTTRDVPARVREMQIGIPGRLRVADRWQCRDPKQVEQAMHRLLMGRRVGGEWFEVTDAEVAEAYAAVSGAGGWVVVRARARAVGWVVWGVGCRWGPRFGWFGAGVGSAWLML